MLDDLLDLRFPSPPPPADLAGKARSRARRRRTAQASVTVIAAAGAAVGIVALQPSPQHPEQRITVASTPVAQHPRTSEKAGATGVLPGIGTGATRPDTFIAFTPGGAERPTLVQTSTGQTISVLGPGAQVSGPLSPDRATLYLPDTKSGAPFGCGQTWSAVTVATGATTPAPALKNLAAVAFAPDGNQFATTIGTDGCANPGEDPESKLVVKQLDRDVSRQVDLPTGNWFVRAWSPDGGSVLLEDLTNQSSTFELFDAQTLAPLSVVPAPPTGCVAGSATLRTDTDVLVGQTCTSGGRTEVDLVDLNGITGQELRRVPIVTGGSGLGTVDNGISLDSSRQNAIFSISINDTSGPDGQVYLLEGTKVVRQGLTGVFGSLW